MTVTTHNKLKYTKQINVLYKGKAAYIEKVSLNNNKRSIKLVKSDKISNTRSIYTETVVNKEN